MGKYVALQSAFTGLSIAFLIAGKLPRETGFLLIALLQPFLLALTLLTSRPFVFQLAPKFRGK